MNNNFLIYACFARSFDKYHINNKKIHLISSIVGYYEDSKKRVIDNYKDMIESATFDSDKLSYLFLVYEDEQIKDILKDTNITVHDNYIVERRVNNVIFIFVSIDQLIGHLSFTIKNNDLFGNIFGNKEMKAKDLDNIYQNSLFVFHNMLWSNIIWKFKICDIHISAGCTSRRHILNSIEIQLNSFLNEIYYNNMSEFKRNIYNISNSKLLNKTIPLDLYKEFLGHKIEIANLSLNEYKESTFQINSNQLTPLTPLTPLEPVTQGNDIIRLYQKNILLSFGILQANIIKQFENKLKFYKDSISKLNNFNNSITYEINKNNDFINSIRATGMSSREKKRYKEERNIVINNPNLYSKLSNMQLNIDKNLKEIEKLNSIY